MELRAKPDLLWALRVAKRQKSARGNNDALLCYCSERSRNFYFRDKFRLVALDAELIDGSYPQRASIFSKLDTPE